MKKKYIYIISETKCKNKMPLLIQTRRWVSFLDIALTIKKVWRPGGNDCWFLRFLSMRSHPEWCPSTVIPAPVSVPRLGLEIRFGIRESDQLAPFPSKRHRHRGHRSNSFSRFPRQINSRSWDISTAPGPTILNLQVSHSNEVIPNQTMPTAMILWKRITHSNKTQTLEKRYKYTCISKIL